VPATLSWVDVSERQQRRMLELLRSWRETETLDELGVGTIRDAFSDLFFPGTSTIQTRARYMLFIPWMYLDFEDQRVPSHRVADRARDYEADIIEALIRNVPDEEGIIGARSRRELQLMPSGIYWTGLASWGIRRFEGTRGQYHASLDRFYERRKRRRWGDSEALPEVSAPTNWHPKLPAPPAGWPEPTTLGLRPQEASFLYDRIMELHTPTLLAQLIDRGVVAREVARVWELPDVRDLPDDLVVEIDHARSFAELMQAADLVYALILTEMRNDDGLADGYREQLSDWADENEARRAAHVEHADQGEWLTIQDRRPASGALRFEREWRAMVLGLSDLHSLADSEEARRLVREREIGVKGRRARVHGGRRLERWNPPGAIGTFDFRWVTVRAIIADIVEGWGRAADA